MAHYSNKYRVYAYRDGVVRFVFEDAVEGPEGVAQTSVVMTTENARLLAVLITDTLNKAKVK